jgi:zinc protease
VDAGLTEEQFQQTREFLHKYVLHYAPTTMDRLGYALDDRFYGMGGSFLEEFRHKMETLTLAEVNEAIKRHWQYGDLQIVIVTRDAPALAKALVADVPSPITYRTPKPAAMLEEDRQISVYPLKIEAQNVRIVPVEELFEK